MDVNLNVLTPNHGDDVRRSAMGGMHQRSLSLSAKWASDKSMAIEYLRRQRVSSLLGSMGLFEIHEKLTGICSGYRRS